MTFIQAFNKKLREVEDNPKKNEGKYSAWYSGKRDYVYHLMCEEDKQWDTPEYLKECQSLQLIPYWGDLPNGAMTDISTL